MRTYDCFGYYVSNDPAKTAIIEFSIPEKNYRFTYFNISNGDRNGLVVNIIPEDPCTELKNQDLYFKKATVELTDKIIVPNLNNNTREFIYDRPIYVFTYHDCDESTLRSNATRCFTALHSYNSILETIRTPAKSGFGALKRI